MDSGSIMDIIMPTGTVLERMQDALERYTDRIDNKSKTKNSRVLVSHNVP